MDLFKLLGKIVIDAGDSEKVLNGISKTAKGVGSVFATVGKGVLMGVGAAATGITALGAAAIKSYADYEQLVGGVETLFGTRGAQSVEEYAQLVGKSVDKVGAEFEMLQEAQSTVMANAANAYKTAGLSANEYMETATSLAAALNQSSASQLDSANLADMAITDMSDNANKMGTSMEALQNAYNGFSKQNYTMLDNLKLGYGGTKEEMQRLLEDAGKLQSAMGRKFDINNFADVTEAIHLMQVEAGISGISYKEYTELVESGAMSQEEAFKLLGTTAKEANFTIAGSMNQLKGAWSNLLTGMSDSEADMDSLINNLVDSAKIAADNILPKIEVFLTAIVQVIQKLAPMLVAEIPGIINTILPMIVEGALQILDAIVQALPQLIDGLMGMLPMLIEGVQTLLEGLATALVAALPLAIEAIMGLADAIMGALPQLIQTLVAALPELIPQLIDAVVNLIMMLVEMLPQIITPIIDALPTIIISIVDALLSNLPVLIQGCVQLIAALAAAIPQIIGALWEAIKGIFVMLGEKILGFFEPVKTAISNAWQAMGNVPGLSAMKTMIENVWGAIKSYISTVINAVKNVISTVWNSIKNVVSTVLNSIKNVITTAWNAVKTIISNVMKLISSVLKGDWEGVKSAISNILNAIKSVIKSIWDGIKNTIKSVLDGIKSVVSSVWNGIKSVISSALNSVKTIVSSVWNGIKGTISGVATGLKTTVTTGFKDIKNKVTGAFKDLPGKLKDIGKNLVEGLWKGISNAKDWVLDKIKGFGKGILNGLKSFFGIQSPSTVMRDEVGRYLAEGVAVGIDEKASVAEEATEKLGEKILQAAEKRLDEFQTYNDMTLAEEVGYWDEVRKLCAEGTDARLEADKKYLDAKKSLDDQILSAEQEFQKKLEAARNKVTERKNSILGSFDLFGDGSSKSAAYSLHQQTQDIEKYYNAINELEAKIGGTAYYEAIKAEGMSVSAEIQGLLGMTDAALQDCVRLYDKRNDIAEKLALDEVGAEVAADTQAAYDAYSSTFTKLGVEIPANTATFENSVVTSFSNIAASAGTAMTSFSGAVVENFQKAETTILSLVQTINDALGALFGVSISGEITGGIGNELNNGIDRISSFADTANTKAATVVEQNSIIITIMQQMQQMIHQNFQQLIQSSQRSVTLDTGVLVGEIAAPMNEALGKLSAKADRGA